MEAVSTLPDLDIEVLAISKATMIFRAINHDLRSHMLRLISSSGEMTVTELYSKLNIEQSLTSQHLAILRKAGFVHSRKRGKFRYYSVNTSRIREIERYAIRINA